MDIDVSSRRHVVGVTTLMSSPCRMRRVVHIGIVERAMTCLRADPMVSVGWGCVVVMIGESWREE